jgi:hypothetical protein
VAFSRDRRRSRYQSAPIASNAAKPPIVDPIITAVLAWLEEAGVWVGEGAAANQLVGLRVMVVESIAGRVLDGDGVSVFEGAIDDAIVVLEGAGSLSGHIPLLWHGSAIQQPANLTEVWSHVQYCCFGLLGHLGSAARGYNFCHSGFSRWAFRRRSRAWNVMMDDGLRGCGTVTVGGMPSK